VFINVVVFALMGTLGCGSGPKAYPVKGKVVFKSGQPVTDGKIQFQSTTEPPFKSLADIDKDGSFTLTTHIGAKKKDGAPAGSYRVVVELERPAEVVPLPTVCTVERGPNEFTIVIDRKSR
jgi:hypothetical protein